MTDAVSSLSEQGVLGQAVLAELRARFPDTPFLALGQTALWDEPTKAALRLALDVVWPDARLIAAAHDTDYFAKLPGHPAGAGDAKYALVGHDDARTRGLWSAAGEMSRLFGSEDVSTQHALQNAGVSLLRVLQSEKPGTDPRHTLGELTEAWGWRGIIYTRWDRKVALDVHLAEILPTLLEQITWAIEGSGENSNAANARQTAQTVRGWVETFARQNTDATLSDLYRELFPRFYDLLLGRPPSNLSTSSTMRLLRFNTETARLPRFAFVDLFLNPVTRRIAIDAYNSAVGGSGAYTLEEFGEGALPFDLVIAGKGRGTLCIPGNGTILVNTPREQIMLCDKGCDFASVNSLARIVEKELGPNVALVGKAVSLLPMLAAEFVLVFHEGASGYTDRTRAMMDKLAARNIRIPNLRPILRMRYDAWSALDALPDDGREFVLPPFLAQAFGRGRIGITDFASCWQRAKITEEHRLKELHELTAPRDLLAYLSRTVGGNWAVKSREYETANMSLLRHWAQAQAIQGRIYTLYDQIRRVRTEAADWERKKGDHFRARVQPLRDQLATLPEPSLELQSRIQALETERQMTFDVEIASRRGQVRYALETVRDLQKKRLVVERGPEATNARVTKERIEAEAERAKAELARNALQAIHGLPHTAHRPSSWWFPVVDPSGAWFRRLAETAEYYLEPLAPDA